jgi:REP element-mobilizing transposase RayT
MRTRKPTRLQGYDYSNENTYFITTNCKNNIHHFGKVQYGEMQLNTYGKIADQQIHWLKAQYPYAMIHNYVIMPNHIQVLMELDHSKAPANTKIKSISSLMGAYKTTTSKMIHLAGNPSFEWHRSFHDSIVRDFRAFCNIDAYITNNPIKWERERKNRQYVTIE